MKLATLAALLFVAPVLAGCLTPPAATDAPSDDQAADIRLPAGVELLPDGTAPPLNFTLTGFIEHVGVFPIPMEEAERSLPEGFTPVPFDKTGAFGTLVVWTYSSNFEGVRPLTNTWVAIPFEPPAELQGDNVDVHAAVLNGFSTDDEVAAIFSAWDIPFAKADIDLGVVVDPAGLRRIGYSRTEDGAGRVMVLETKALGETTDAPVGRDRFYGIEEGKLRGVFQTDHNGYSYMDGQATLGSDEIPLVGIAPKTGGVGVHVWDLDAKFTFLPLDLGETARTARDHRGGGAS